MAIIKGCRDYEKFKKGETLTLKQAILAQCYVCNGIEEGGEDCRGRSCPLYQFMPYREGKKKKVVSARQIEILRQAREKAKITRLSSEKHRG